MTTPENSSQCNPQPHINNTESFDSLTDSFDESKSYSVHDKIFDLFVKAKYDKNRINISNFIQKLGDNGLKKDDPRLKEMFKNLKLYQEHQLMSQSSPGLNGPNGQLLDCTRDSFQQIVDHDIEIIKKIFSKLLIIPDFKSFTDDLTNIFNHCKKLDHGKPSDYLPQLQRMSGGKHWGMSVCTIDGQRFSLGDSTVPFTLQSVSNPFTYAMSLNQLGSEYVHKYIGREPSGDSTGAISLDKEKKPHNPIINTGAILTTALLNPDKIIGDRFDYIHEKLKKSTGKDENLSFNNSIFLTERSLADRNYALAYLMKENKCYPEEYAHKFLESLELYFQISSMEANCEDIALMAATLANGGVAALSGEIVYKNEIIKHVLSLMLSCGCYDYSGQFAFEVGVPAKSSITGCVMLVIPNLAGICLWSPNLDRNGCSVRGVEFCKQLIKNYNFHNFDCINQSNSKAKKDPRVSPSESRGIQVMNLLFAAQAGDLSALMRYHLLEYDMDLADYDGRTALHIATSEGHEACVDYLLKVCKCSPFLTDRWGHTAKDEAVNFGHKELECNLSIFMNKPRVRKSFQKGLDKLNLERLRVIAEANKPNFTSEGTASVSDGSINSIVKPNCTEESDVFITRNEKSHSEAQDENDSQIRVHWLGTSAALS